MKVLVDINHPAHVHLFKYLIIELRKRGHAVRITSRDKDITLKLLDNYGIDHTVLSRKRSGLIGLAFEYSQRLEGVYGVVKEFNPDVMIGLNPAITHVSKITDSKSIILHDTEPATLKEYMFSPFADLILTPECFEKDLGSNQVRYPGYQELAYLHPDRFDPDPTHFHSLPIDPNDYFILIRLVSWDASHDIGDEGIMDLSRVIDRLEEGGARVLITSENDLPPEYTDYELNVDVTGIHDIMYYADAYLGESATMATECVLLGTPAVFVSSSTRGYIHELENDYGLLHSFTGNGRTEKGLSRVIELMKDKGNFIERRTELLADKGDTTSTMLHHVTDLGS